MKKTYDRLSAGSRIRAKRMAFGMTQDEMAEKIDRAAKYYADIERGNCGMSIETLMALSSCLNMSLDDIIYGAESNIQKDVHEEEVTAILDMLDSISEKKRRFAIRLLQLFLIACNSK